VSCGRGCPSERTWGLWPLSPALWLAAAQLLRSRLDCGRTKTIRRCPHRVPASRPRHCVPAFRRRRRSPRMRAAPKHRPLPAPPPPPATLPFGLVYGRRRGRLRLRSDGSSPPHPVQATTGASSGLWAPCGRCWRVLGCGRAKGVRCTAWHQLCCRGWSRTTHSKLRNERAPWPEPRQAVARRLRAARKRAGLLLTRSRWAAAAPDLLGRSLEAFAMRRRANSSGLTKGRPLTNQRVCGVLQSPMPDTRTPVTHRAPPAPGAAQHQRWAALAPITTPLQHEHTGPFRACAQSSTRAS
jgi:hypothetical protein